MYLIPLIYFSSLTYYLWQKHHRFDVSVYMSLLYVITSLCCVFMVAGGHLEGGGVLYEGWEPDFGFVPTVLYCGLITLTIIPFSFIRPELIEKMGNSHRFVLLGFSLFIMLQGLLMMYLVGDSLKDLLNGDFLYLKNSYYKGDISPADEKMLTMPGPVQALFLLSHLTIFGLPLFFYYTCMEKRSPYLMLPLLAVSISPILRGMLIADRTEIIHYGLMLIFCLVFFSKYLDKRIVKFFGIIGAPVLAVGMIYIVAVSMSRFEDDDEGTGGTMLQYAGQSYANFCYFYDNHNPELIYVERELPITMFFLTKTQYTDTKMERSAKEGFFIGVFASHVGSWMLDTGVAGSILISVIFALLCISVIGYVNRTEYDVADFLLLYILATVPIFGIFYYRFYHIALAFQYMAAVILYILSKYKIVWRNNKEE